MKKVIILVITVLSISTISAQDSKAYLGVSVGYAIPGGEGSEDVNSGINIGFINFGYRFTKTWGATLNLTSSGFTYKNAAYGSAMGIAKIDATYKGTGFVLGSSLNFGVTKGFKLSLNVDYTSFKFSEVELGGVTTPLDSNNTGNELVLGAGLRYNF